jgi:hypothetical protein
MNLRRAVQFLYAILRPQGIMVKSRIFCMLKAALFQKMTFGLRRLPNSISGSMFRVHGFKGYNRWILLQILIKIRHTCHALPLQNFFIVGWALPTKNNQIQLLTVGNAHPTGILLESTNSKYQIHRRISSHACTYAVGETNSA